MAATDPRYEDGNFLVRRANETLDQLHVPIRVNHWSDIGAEVFVTLFEGISGEPLRDIIRDPKTKEDEIHNVQVVIDTLSLDILHISLSHITGEEVVAGSKRAIGNLLEVVFCLMEFVLEEIRSEAASDVEEYENEAHDPDLVTREFIDDILEKELRKCHVSGNTSATDSLHNTYTKSAQNGSYFNGSSANSTGGLAALSQNRGGDHRAGFSESSRSGVAPTANSTAELIALGTANQDDFSQVSANDTAALIALGDSKYGQYSPPKRGPRDDYKTLQKVADLSSRDMTGGSVPESSFTCDGNTNSLNHNLNGTLDFPPSTNGGLYVNESRDTSTSMSIGSNHLGRNPPAKLLISDLASTSSVDAPQASMTNYTQPVSEFDYIGVRPHPVTSAVPAGGAVIGALGSVLDGTASTSYTHHHHLYHHYERPDRAGVTVPKTRFSTSLNMDQFSRGLGGMGLPQQSLDHSNQNSRHGRMDDRLASTLPVKTGSSIAGNRMTSTLQDQGGTRTVDAQGVTVRSTLTGRSMEIENRLASTLPIPSQSAGNKMEERLASTVPLPARYSLMEDKTKVSTASTAVGQPSGMGAKAQSYDNLQNLMHNTVALSRAAVRTSPLRHQTSPIPQTNIEDSSPTLSESVRSTLRNISGELSALKRNQAREMVRASAAPGSVSESRSDIADKTTQSICSPSRKGDKTNKKVSFKMSRSSEESKKSVQSSPRRNQQSSHDKDLVRHPSRTSATKKSQEVPARRSLRMLYNGSTPPLPSRPRSRPSKPWQSNTSGRRGSGKTSGSYSTSRKRSPVPDFRVVPTDPCDIPRTFQDYLDKYYGAVERRDRLASSEIEDEELASPHSDSAFELGDGPPGRCDADYSGDADVSEDVDVDLEQMRRAVRLPLSVRFDDILDASAPGRMNSIRRKLGNESKVARTKAEALAQLYEMELDDFQGDINSQMRKTRQSSLEKDKHFKKKVLVGPKTNKYKPARKYQTSVLRPRSSSLSRGRKSSAPRGRKRSVSASPSVGRRGGKSPVRVSDDDLLPWLLEEFPFLHLSTQTLHDLWRKSSKQIEQLTHAEREVRRRKPKAQVQIEEAERRQNILLDIMKKELAHNHRVKDLKERQVEQQNVRTQLRTRRMQSACARRYYDEYQVRMRSKMLKKRTKEELVFKRLFHEGLDIQKERIRELRRYAREQRDVRAQRQENDLEAIENYYRDQFTMLNEAMRNERHDLEIKDKAQSKVVEKMKKELRQKMEREIKNFQEQMYRDEDDEYFRQLDADRLRHQLQLARYQASI